MHKRALFSLYDQTGVVPFARQLIGLGWEIIATKETFTLLKKNKLKSIDVSDFFGVKEKYPFPPTLHPKMELVLTTDTDKQIDLVYDTTYPLDKGNDVGGHTLLALASKGMRIVVCDRNDMKAVIEQLKRNNNEISNNSRQRLIKKAYEKIAKHYLLLSSGSKNIEIDKTITVSRKRQLLEGENPYQVPAYLLHSNTCDSLALGFFEQLCGPSPCFTNMADFDSILHTICLVGEAFDKYYGKLPYIVIASKHGNPCGFAIDWENPSIAIEKALFGNPIAIWGGEVITNFHISTDLAEKLFFSKEREKILGNPKWMLDVVVAPDFDAGAIEILKKNANRKLFKNNALFSPYVNKEKSAYRMVRGGFLKQPLNNYILDFKECNIDFLVPGSIDIDSVIIAWATAWSSIHGGNEIAIAKDRMLLSAAGGPSTFNAALTAIDRAKKCKHNLKNSVFAADAFFPFTDVPEVLVKSGCIYGIVPDGGKNAKLVKDFFKKNKVNVFYLPERFRGFCRH